MQTFALEEYAALLPIIACVLAGLAALVADIYLPRGSKVVLAWISLAGVVLAGIAAALVWSGDRDRVVLGGAIAVSRLGFGLALSILLAGAATSLYSAHYAESTPIATGEHYGLLLLGMAGMLALVVANDFATLFVAIETLSVSVYALTGLFRAKARSAEGAMKYFILGAFSSGFLLYGIALVYASAGTLRLDLIHARGIGAGGPLAVCGVALILVGLLFKVGAVPFHSWIPDAYEGAPASVTGFMSVAVKAAAFAAALRVLVALGPHRNLAAHPELPESGMQLGWILWAVAALTMIVGNAGAFTQTNPRRLLAYSGIAHTGYALTGLVAIARFSDTARGLGAPGLALDVAAHDAAAGVIYYLVGYGVANLAAFSVLCYLERGGEDIDDIAALTGLARTRPLAALAMTISMISLAGVPLTSGFIAKLWVFKAAVAAGNTGLVVLAVLTSALSLGYYLQPVVRMYMRSPVEESDAPPDAWKWGPRFSLGLMALGTVVLGVAPWKLLDLAEKGAGALF
ncbi:NADH-quinone oxidoreductase subunit N [bacterium]|nr:NADH-quinone oxidoreductase subunit N [bacterium]